MDCKLYLIIYVHSLLHHFQVIDFLRQVYIHQLHFNTECVSKIFNVLLVLFVLSVYHFQCLMDLSDFFRSDVLEVNTPLLSLQFGLFAQLPQLVRNCRLLLFICANYIIESSHLRLYH